MRIAVLYNPPGHTPTEQHWLRQSAAQTEGFAAELMDFQDESEVGFTTELQSVVDALTGDGHEVALFAVEDAAALCRFLEQHRPDLIFNRCELFLDQAELEMNVAAVFELCGVPFTGSPAATLAMALDKGIAKAILHAHGIATPPYAVISAESEIPAALSDAGHRLQLPRSAVPPQFPLIVKPLREDGSTGIDVRAVVQDKAALVRRVRFVLRQFRQPALVEEFIDGRELTVSVLATTQGQFVTLPIAEILFGQLPGGVPKIVGYEAKWIANSPHDRGTVPCCPAALEAAMADRVREIALHATRSLGIRDYGRVDFRLRESDNQPFVLEVNPNPDLSRDGGFIRAAKASGRTYASTLCEIVTRASERASRT